MNTVKSFVFLRCLSFHTLAVQAIFAWLVFCLRADVVFSP